MTRRRVLLLGSVGVVAALALAWAVWPRPSAISYENGNRLHRGMTLAVVEDVLGGPARKERGGFAYAPPPTTKSFGLGLPEREPHDWSVPDLLIRIWFDEQARPAGQEGAQWRRPRRPAPQG